MADAARILSAAPNDLPDAELLGVVLGARDQLVAPRLLANGLPWLRRASPGELLLTPGVTASQVARLQAALELGRRVALSTSGDRPRLANPDLLTALMWPRLAHLQHEEFWAVLLNAQLQEIRSVRIATGGLTQCSVLPREAFLPALLHRAAAVAFVHNHPSGNPQPSSEDCRLQLLLDEAAHVLGVRVVDHLVLSEGGAHSVSEGLRPPPSPDLLVPRGVVG
jgi:DNA repair protein RadC